MTGEVLTDVQGVVVHCIFLGDACFDISGFFHSPGN